MTGERVLKILQSTLIAWRGGVSIYTWIYTYTWIYIYIYIPISSLYLYIYIYTYLYLYIYIHCVFLFLSILLHHPSSIIGLVEPPHRFGWISPCLLSLEEVSSVTNGRGGFQPPAMQPGATVFRSCFLKWWVPPKKHPKCWSFLVGKPMGCWGNPSF